MYCIECKDRKKILRKGHMNCLLECGCLQNQKTIEYVSLIIVNEEIDENYEGKSYMWLSERINERKAMYKMYNCPGGHINEGETEREAIEREVYEETNLVLTKEGMIKKIGTLTVENDKNREKGLKVIHVYEIITEERLQNTETQNLGPWKLYTFNEVLELSVIDSVKYYMCEKIKQLVRQKQFLIVEGTIGSGKSTTIEEYLLPTWNEMAEGMETVEKAEAIPEVTLSEELKPKLKEFYEGKILPIEFQRIIESHYFKILCEEILFDKKKEGRYILDRNQTSTYIFSKNSNISNEEIEDLKKNREYFDEIIKNGHIIFIKSSRERVIKNQKKRARTEEESIDINYLEALHDVYFYLMKEAYKPILIDENTSIIEDISIIDNTKNIKRKKNHRSIRRQVKEILEKVTDELELRKYMREY
jgi:ADP-ribose pyrophosphatase YjhB (NUDIX family)